MSDALTLCIFFATEEYFSQCWIFSAAWNNWTFGVYFWVKEDIEIKWCLKWISRLYWVFCIEKMASVYFPPVQNYGKELNHKKKKQKQKQNQSLMNERYHSEK